MNQNPSSIKPLLSIIIPVLNENDILTTLVDSLACYRQCDNAEVIFVDGGSTDGTVACLDSEQLYCITSACGRATQMNAGAAQASGSIVLFLHADTRLPFIRPEHLLQRMQQTKCKWGRFDISISGNGPWFPVISWAMNLRSRLTGVATGDQALFIEKQCFKQLRGFALQPLMEDIEISKRLRQISRPLCLKKRVITSGRRWQQGGVIKTILLMWRLRLAYWLGQNPEHLARLYHN